MCCYYFYLTVKNNGSKIQVKESYRTGLRARPDRPISQARLPATASTAGLHFVLRSGFKKAQQFYNNKRSSEKNNSDNFWKSFLFCVIFKINFGHKKKVGRKCFTTSLWIKKSCCIRGIFKFDEFFFMKNEIFKVFNFTSFLIKKLNFFFQVFRASFDGHHKTEIICRSRRNMYRKIWYVLKFVVDRFYVKSITYICLIF